MLFRLEANGFIWTLLTVLDFLFSRFSFHSVLHSGSYMSAHVLLNLLKWFGENDKMRGFAEHLINFPQQV